MILRILIFSLLISGCSSIKMLNDEKKNLTSLEELDQSDLNEVEIAYVEEKVIPKKVVPQKLEIIKLTQSSNKKTTIKNKLKLDYKKKHYNFWVNYFKNKNSKRFSRHLKNADKYEKLVKSIFREHNLPEDLFYVGLIESGFNSHARSHANAVGPWQFIKGTATRYNLRVDAKVDERRNIVKATHGAAGYFKDLYNIFGSWDLALCAYNAGEYRIINAIRRGNTRDYKTLVRKKLLPKETIFYIPKVAAAKYLANSRYFKRNNPKSTKFDSSEMIKMKGSFNLARLARDLKINYRDLKVINPDILVNNIRVGRKAFRLLLPKSSKAQKAKYSSYSKKLAPVKRIYRSTATTSKTKSYKVRRGDNLSKLSRKFSTTISELKRLNKLKRSSIRIGQRLKVPSSSKHVYVVRKGDNLTLIARKFSTTIAKLVSKNDLKRRTIFPLQELVIPRG